MTLKQAYWYIGVPFSLFGIIAFFTGMFIFRDLAFYLLNNDLFLFGLGIFIFAMLEVWLLLDFPKYFVRQRY